MERERGRGMRMRNEKGEREKRRETEELDRRGGGEKRREREEGEERERWGREMEWIEIEIKVGIISRNSHWTLLSSLSDKNSRRDNIPRNVLPLPQSVTVVTVSLIITLSRIYFIVGHYFSIRLNFTDLHYYTDVGLKW
jgi:hypothetical protein